MSLVVPFPRAEQTVDLLIIGGGIAGAGVARDATLRGLSVVLVEQGDFASGASSQTSKLIHGGLRYLEQARFHLVFESLRERATLLRVAPRLVRPLPFLIPSYRGDARGRGLLHLGLSLYDALGLFGPLSRHRCLGAAPTLRLEPALAPEGLRGGIAYQDAQVQDARLCLENILEAQAHGAVCRNYCRVVELTREGGRLTGAVVEDVADGRRPACAAHGAVAGSAAGRHAVRARVVVNAAGPWADRVRRMSDPSAAPRLRPTKGIHLVTRRLAGDRALLVAARRDGRVFFILPWETYTLIGTTEAETGESPETVRATAAEAAYLLAETNRVLPQVRVGPSDVLATFAGLRPLIAGSGGVSSLSREHAIEVDRHGLVSLLGGKFTTYRRMAEETVDLLVRRRRLSAAAACATRRQPLATSAARDAAIAALIAAQPSLRERLCPHHPHVRAEVLHAFEHEQARTISDFCFRRTRLAYSPCHAEDALPAIAELLVRHLGWTAAQAQASITAHQAEVRAMLACVAGT